MLTGRHNKTQRTKARQPQQQLETSTVRVFDGGLNLANNDLNMEPKFARVLDNIERALDGSLAVRPGTTYLGNVDNWGNSNDIINCTYFNGYIICVQSNGAITKTDGSGVTTQMLLGGVNPWVTPITVANFATFNSDLIIVNGNDKPLIIAGVPSNPNYMTLQFLVDLASLSNINTPVGSYVVTHGQYLIIAGVSNALSTIYISAKGTSGTFTSDPPPNDAITLDLGSRVSVGSSTITGLVAYRDKLIVTFERGAIPLNLGNYTGSPTVHTPTDDGFIEEYGCQSHRSLVAVSDEAFFCDNIGINAIQRVAPFNTLKPIRASQNVAPDYIDHVKLLTTAEMAQRMFAVYDLRNKRYMLFVPVKDNLGNITETIVYSYTNIANPLVRAWARLRGWNFRSACRTSLENVIFSRGTKLYYYDFDAVNRSLDRFGDPAVNSGNGESITFDWELPWADFQKRMHVKLSKFLALDTQGTGVFTAEMYIDNIRNENGVKTPILTMDFIGGEAGGYGNTPFGSTPFGGGRMSADERLYPWDARFKIMKLRFKGTTAAPVKFVSISIGYIRGTVRR